MKWITMSTGLTVSLVLGILILAVMAPWIVAAPVGPTITHQSYSSGSSTSATLVDNSSHTGGTIATANLDVRQQNLHWKAYVGNITGKLVLEDGSNYSIYEWSQTSVQGEVYATRGTSITWANLECANLTELNIEMLAMNHTSAYTLVDNITATMDDDKNDHDQFYAGTTNIAADTCNYTINLYLNDTAQSAGQARWEEVVLFQEVENYTVYVSLIDENYWGYHNGTLYDYQILLPEKGEPTFTGATSYYFYVELL